MRREGESADRIRWMADQRGSEEGAWGFVVEVVGGRGRRAEVEAVRVVVSEPKLVLRLMSAVAVVAVEAKLRDWRSSARSSSHGDGDGSIALLGRERVRVRVGAGAGAWVFYEWESGSVVCYISEMRLREVEWKKDRGGAGVTGC